MRNELVVATTHSAKS